MDFFEFIERIFEFIESIKEILLVLITWILAELKNKITEKRILKKEAKKKKKENLENYINLNPKLFNGCMNADSNFDLINISQLREEVRNNFNMIYLLEEDAQDLLIKINNILSLQGAKFSEKKYELKNILVELKNVFNKINKEIA